jgi:hypothetical protein
MLNVTLRSLKAKKKNKLYSLLLTNDNRCTGNLLWNDIKYCVDKQTRNHHEQQRLCFEVAVACSSIALIIWKKRSKSLPNIH